MNSPIKVLQQLLLFCTMPNCLVKLTLTGFLAVGAARFAPAQFNAGVSLLY
jgi:hypothetical protein